MVMEPVAPVAACVAVRVTLPAAALTSAYPVAEMEMPGSDGFQVTSPVTSWVEPLGSVAVTRKRSVVPARSCVAPEAVMMPSGFGTGFAIGAVAGPF
jgi:hypothetical protein